MLCNRPHKQFRERQRGVTALAAFCKSIYWSDSGVNVISKSEVSIDESTSVQTMELTENLFGSSMLPMILSPSWTNQGCET